MIIVPEARIAEMKRQGWWGEQTIGDRVTAHAEARGDAEALVDPPNLADIADIAPRRLSWNEVEAGTADRAALLASLGIGKDDVVMIQLPNSVDLTLYYLACFQLGAIVSPAPAQYRLAELTSIARRTDAVAAITCARIGQHRHGETMLAMKAECATVREVLVLGDAPAGAVATDVALLALGDAERAAVKPMGITADDVATICWTSGTEAEPKGVPRSHNEWLIMGEATARPIGLHAESRILNPFPMVNMAGLSTGLFNWLAFGGTLVLHHPFDLTIFLRQLREERIDYTVAPPAVLNAMLNNPDLVEGVDFARLARIGSGSAPLSEWMVSGFDQRYGVEIINIFGSNEGAAFLASAEDVPDPFTRGQCFPRFGASHGFSWHYPYATSIETKLVDPETGSEVTEPEVAGELRVKSPMIFSGYWQSPEATARAFDEDGWFRTGDLFAITGLNNRYYRFSGRHKDIVVRGGMNISSEEIENHLLSHPEVLDVAVIGAPDPVLGERLCACVVAPGGLTIETLNRYLVEERRLAIFKQIERLELLDALPRNPVGKILKRELRATLFGQASH
jgi:acyl-CoA synthetase (AMP-forming)/AMP-acid ligase II